MKIAIVGAGYVGLVSSVCFAEIGHQVICVDIDAKKVAQLRKGKATIYEPGLDELLKKNIQKKRLSFTTSIPEATKKSTAIFIAVGTPSKKNGDPDLTYVENVARQVALCMDSYKLVVEKSTVPAETGKRVARTIRLNLPKKYQKGSPSAIEFDVASNPEFLREGSAIGDFMDPDRVVIGVESKRAEKLLREIYEPLKPKMVVTDINSAEMIKHASNSFLATKISFINAVAQICDKVGADVLKVAEGMGYDKRIGRSFLNAGIGYGGSCFPKDVDAFVRLAERSGYEFSLLRSVREVNVEQQQVFLKLVEDKLWNLKDKVVGVLGLAFKPETDDMRSAPSINIINMLLSEGANVKAYDPQAMSNAAHVLKQISYEKDPYTLAKDCDCLLFLTEWKEFADLDFERIKDLMRQPIIFDGRNMFAGKKLSSMGFEYHGIGRGKR